MTLPIPPTLGTLAELRKQGFSELFLAMEQPNTIFSCQVNQTFATHDRVAEVIYDNATGDYLDVRPGMTAYVGSTEGARDLGAVRVRKAPTSSILYIGEESEIEFDDDVWLTVVDQFAIWPKHIRINNRIAYMDWDEAYSNQHALFDPVPVLGSHRVAWLNSNVETYIDDADVTYSGSWSSFGNIHSHNGTIHQSDVAAASASSEVFCSRIRILGWKGPNMGKADVYIDGELSETIDAYGTVEEYQQVIFDSGEIGFGLHEVELIVKHEKSAESTWYWILFDALLIDSREVNLNFDATASWVFNGTISSVAWSAPGSAEISSPAATSTDIVYDRPGQYMVYCTVTADNEKEFTAARRVFVFDEASPPLSDFTLDDCQADIDDGGWSFSVSTRAAQASDVLERNLCILFSRDYHDNAEVSYGPLEGHETILAIGWVGKNTTEYDANSGTVSFDVYGPQYWLKQMSAFPTGLELSPRAPTAWTEIKELTVDKGVWHILHWRTTCTIILDYIPQLENVQYVKELSASTGTIWQQIGTFTWSTIFARLLFNRYGQGFLAVDPQLVPEASRTWDAWSLPKVDIFDGIRLSASNNGVCAMVNLSGVNVNLSGSAAAYFSLSMGHVYTRVGRPEILDRLLVVDQAQSNSLSGLVMGWKNNNLPSIRFDTLRDNRFFDIAPRVFVSIEIEETDTPRGITFDGNTIIRRIEVSHSDGVLRTSLDLEAETFEMPSTNGDIPDSPEDEDISFPPPPPPPDLPPLEITGEPIEVCFVDDVYGFLYTLDFDSESPTWFIGNSGLDVYEQDALDRLEVSLFSGRIYVAALGMQKIWSAFVAGGAWQIVTDRETILGISFPGWEESVGWRFYFKAFGMNLNAPDEIALIAGRTSSPYVSDNYLYLGNYAGVSPTNSTPFYSKGGSGTGEITFGGKWVLTGQSNSIFWENAIFVFPDGGGDAESTTVLPTSIGVPHHARAGTSDIIFEHQADRYNSITDNGGSVSLLGYDTVGNYEQAADIDPTGQIVMASKGANGRQISTDGGTSWSDLTELPYTGSERYKFHNCMNPSQWIAGHTGIYYSADQGATWVDKTGNLLELLPSLDVKIIRVMRYGDQTQI